MDLSREALDLGVLLGRYPRCDNQPTDAASIFSNESVSRVHVLLLRIQGKTYALDVASTNGLWCEGESIRLVPMVSGTTLHIASEEVKLSWVTDEGRLDELP